VQVWVLDFAIPDPKLMGRAIEVQVEEYGKKIKGKKTQIQM
jgi:hypothetical protein